MQKIGKRIVLLFGIFLLSFVVFSVLTGKEGTVSETQEMSEATFPVLFFTCGGEEVNETFGYVQQMDGSTIRDTITPVMEDLTIPVTIDAYDNTVNSVSYNIYASDGEELYEEHSAISAEVKDGEASISLVLYDEIDTDEEAVLEVVLNINDGTQLYYYTRLVMQNDVPVTLGMSFVKTFHEETLSDSDGSSLTAYLESSSGTEYTTLDHVTIESSLELVMWGSLEPILASEVSLDVAEINDSYQAYTMTYLVSSVLTGSTYYVEEYYRIRIISSQAYLLDYDRTAEQIFAATSTAVSDDALQLGIRNADVDYVSNEDGSIIAFLQAGELWEYDANTGELIRVYGYLDTDASGSADADFRDLNMDHTITVCTMDDSGNLYFMLSGYRNRGIHEGENGVSLYYYDAINQTVEERLYLSSDCAGQVLQEEIGDLAYVNADGTFCMIYGGTLYGISSDTAQVQELVSGIDLEYYMVSESGRYAAFLYEGWDSTSQALSVIDLDTGEITEISGNGGYVRPIGYLGENLVYGVASADDIVTDSAGNVTFAMNILVILDTDLTVAKEYDEGSYYVTEAVIEDGAVQLTRVTKSGSGYESASEDTIIDYDSLDDTSAVIATASLDGTEETQIVITLTVSAADEIALKIPEAIVTQVQEQSVLLQTSCEGYTWRAWRAQKLIYAGSTLSDAITAADETAGVVTSDTGTVIWRRNNDSSASLSDIEDVTDAEDSGTACLISGLIADGISAESASSAVSSASSVEEAVVTVLPSALYLDLSGCTVDEVLWFTAQGRPVMMVIDDVTYIITYYSSSYVKIYNPRTGGSETYSVSTLDSMAEDNGSIFYTWLM